MATEIVDFGEKIGGARKDISGGITLTILRDLNDAERRKYVKRDTVWPLKNAVKQVEGGLTPFIVFWQREVRRSTNPGPIARKDDTAETFLEKCETYINQMNDMRAVVEAVTDENALDDFYDKMYNNADFNWHERFGECMPQGEIKRSLANLSWMRRKVIRDGFPYKERRKAERKPRFIPPQLDHIERGEELTDYRHGMNVNDVIWQKRFNFRGVEFGNWTSQKDRQFSMNYAYDALRDLAWVLGIKDTDIAFNGKLALAFGARGVSGANAHYEPLREVINLTKMHGAGCTAHEWFHAMDDRLGKWLGLPPGKLASEYVGTNDEVKLPQPFVTLINATQFDADGKFTDFYRGSRKMDSHFSKDSHGYWSSCTEMAARAFACYVKDSLGTKSDYLIAHSDVYEFEFDEQRFCAIPQGDERDILDDLFDVLFYDLKSIGFFTQRLEIEDKTDEFPDFFASTQSPRIIPAGTAQNVSEDDTYFSNLLFDEDNQARIAI